MKTKKLISVALALIMALALAVPAMAEGEESTAPAQNQIIHTGEKGGAWEYKDSIKDYTGERTVDFSGDWLFIKQSGCGYLWVADGVKANYMTNRPTLRDSSCARKIYSLGHGPEIAFLQNLRAIFAGAVIETSTICSAA